jgi:hypothetical protein
VLIGLLGLLSAAVAVAAFFTPVIRRVELDLPDHVPDDVSANATPSPL